jgi:hypothetical protein
VLAFEFLVVDHAAAVQGYLQPWQSPI